MKKYCLALDLKDDPKLIAEYEAYHKNVWPEIIESIKKSGIEVLDIYRTGNRMFMIIEANDDFNFEQKAAMDAADPTVQEWEELMWKFQQALPWAKPGEKWILMEKILSYPFPVTSNQQPVTMIIDTHVHFWKYDKVRDAWITSDMKILKQDYVPAHLIPTLKRNGVDGCVAVQASQSEYETHFLVELSKTHPEIKGVVGWVDLLNKNLEERLQFFSQYSIIKGWRHIVQAEPGDFLLREDFQNGIRALAPYDCTYDILIYHHQLKAALGFVTKFPDQRFVIDHCAKPDIGKKDINEWRVLMKEMAKHPNVYCKLSGLLTETKWKQWSPADFYPYLDVVFEGFGSDRLMFGSDWPVMLLSGIYVQWKSLLEKYMENFVEEDRLKVFGENAIEFYNL